MSLVNLSIPDEVIYEFKSSGKRGDNLDNRLRLNLAIGLFVNQEMSLAKCAQMSGLDLVDFMNVLQNIGIPSLYYSEEMLSDDLMFVSKE